MVLAASPDWTHCMNDKARWQIISAGDFRFTGPATAEITALSHKLGSGATMNSAINSSAAEECGVRCIDDGIRFDRCDIAPENLNSVNGFLFRQF